MKEKIIIFVIGLLLGAVISTGAFFVYTKANSCSNNGGMQMPGGTPPSMPNGETQGSNVPQMPNTQNESN